MNNFDVLTEATIDAIRVESTKKEIRIDVTCRWKGEKRQQIIAKGVDDFIVNEMRLSNIIDRVTRLNAGSGQEEEEAARRLFFMMRGREPGVGDLEWPLLLEKLGRIRAGTLILMELEPVYGATVIILAESLQLEAPAKRHSSAVSGLTFEHGLHLDRARSDIRQCDDGQKKCRSDQTERHDRVGRFFVIRTA